MSAAQLPPPAHPSRAHLVAAVLAVALLAAAVVVWSIRADRQERASFAALLPILTEPHDYNESDRANPNYVTHLKNQGTALQRIAFERGDQLPLYGSSELLKRIPEKASIFFRTCPTGFAVFPVGRPGSTSLTLLEKLTALGEVTRGRRVAISLSPSWFLLRARDERRIAANFSQQAALASLLNSSLSFHFRRELARDFLLHPETLRRDPILRFCSARLARRDALNRALYAAAWPLAELKQTIYVAQEHFELAAYLSQLPGRYASRFPPQPAVLDWDQFLAEASARTVPFQDTMDPPNLEQQRAREAQFREAVASAPEWADLKLLVRGLHELGMRPLILCMPADGRYLEKNGVERASLARFPERVQAIASRWGACVETFADHTEDAAFLADPYDHLSPRGWMYYNRALDAFYHADPSNLARGLDHLRPKHRRTASRDSAF